MFDIRSDFKQVLVLRDYDPTETLAIFSEAFGQRDKGEIETHERCENHKCNMNTLANFKEQLEH